MSKQLPEKCPKCGADLISGYGLMGGGIGLYVVCDTDGCDFFEKQQDAEAGVEEGR